MMVCFDDLSKEANSMQDYLLTHLYWISLFASLVALFFAYAHGSPVPVPEDRDPASRESDPRGDAVRAGKGRQNQRDPHLGPRRGQTAAERAPGSPGLQETAGA